MTSNALCAVSGWNSLKFLLMMDRFFQRAIMVTEFEQWCDASCGLKLMLALSLVNRGKDSV